ncbi:MAG: hypothetical protein ACYTFG_09195, partial [Planctomycetota bacterium]
MLVYLCDRCHASMSAEDAKRSKSLGGDLLCPRCLNRGRQRPPTLGKREISCDDCQVAVSQSRFGGADWGEAANVFCSTCEKLTGQIPAKKFRCTMCRSVISIDDLRSGRAVSRGEKAYCSTCKRRADTPIPEPQ